MHFKFISGFNTEVKLIYNKYDAGVFRTNGISDIQA